MMSYPPQRVYPSPEAAGMAGFPPEHCRVVASAVEGDDGIVIADTGPPGAPYLYATSVSRKANGWVDGASGNALGWTLTDEARDLGTLAVWEEAPAGADRVRVAFERQVYEVPVTNGAYLMTWWRVPCPERRAWPQVVAFRINGVWEAAKPWRPGAMDVAPGA